ncbi:DUF6114 domain-containing protein [Agromyces seonyuensis]|uniref:Integral membrane protein n=1 Tax=Agromyces seonyuensis TaxID=2662446 RepID=A0A6I4NZB0_9MICO|nr:DUF6114 domain-containing protein [Agromyces seonyuensis]MWB99628.1 hypothetical protein [Agromyces seonyuensis]
MDAHAETPIPSFEPVVATAPGTRRARRGRPRGDSADPLEPAASSAPTARGALAPWYRSRPVIGGALTILGGIAMFGSSQLELGGMTVHVGIEGAQAMILPAVLIVCGALAVLSPAQHLFYGIVAMIIAVYSLVGVNLGGFFVGFLLGAVGGIVVASWRPRTAADEPVAVPADPPAIAGRSPERDAADVAAPADGVADGTARR